MRREKGFWNAGRQKREGRGRLRFVFVGRITWAMGLSAPIKVVREQRSVGMGRPGLPEQ